MYSAFLNLFFHFLNKNLMLLKRVMVVDLFLLSTGNEIFSSISTIGSIFKEHYLLVSSLPPVLIMSYVLLLPLFLLLQLVLNGGDDFGLQINSPRKLKIILSRIRPLLMRKRL